MKRCIVAAMEGLAVDMIQQYVECSHQEYPDAPWNKLGNHTKLGYMETLREVFEPASKIHLTRETFKMMKQSKDDDMATYITRKFYLYSTAYPVIAERSFQLFFDEVVKGTYSTKVKCWLLEKASGIRNLEQLRESAYEGASYYRKVYMMGMTDMVPNLDGLLPSNQLAKAGLKESTSEAMEIDALKEQIEAMKMGDKSNIKCYSCNKTGHLAKDCWSKNKGQKAGQGKGGSQPPKFKGKCGWCKKTGHKEADCFAKKRDKGGKTGTVASQGKGSQRIPPQRIRTATDGENEDFLEEEGPLVEEE